MNISSREEGGYAIIGFDGDVDLSCSPEVRKLILHSLEAGQHLLIDLSKVSYIDSSGVACLVEGYQTAKNMKLEFGLVGVSEAAMSVLHLARLDKVFPIHTTVEECLRKDG